MNKKTSILIFISLLIIGILLDLLPIEVPDGVDKFYHFIGFSVITMSAITMFISFFGKKYLNLFFMIILIFGGLFAGISETLQKMTEIRGCNVFDWVANLGGISFACVLIFLVNAFNGREEI